MPVIPAVIVAAKVVIAVGSHPATQAGLAYLANNPAARKGIADAAGAVVQGAGSVVHGTGAAIQSAGNVASKAVEAGTGKALEIGASLIPGKKHKDDTPST